MSKSNKEKKDKLHKVKSAKDKRKENFHKEWESTLSIIQNISSQINDYRPIWLNVLKMRLLKSVLLLAGLCAGLQEIFIRYKKSGENLLETVAKVIFFFSSERLKIQSFAINLN